MLKMPVDTSDFVRGANDLELRQVPIATMWALNDTAYDVLGHMQDRMDRVFDRPTRYTKNAFMVWRAKKSTLSAEIKERPSVSSRHFLKVQERGGSRGKTGLEKLLDSQLADGGQISAVVPAAGARVNKFGNWSPAERKQVLSAVQGGNTTKKRVGYFVPRPGSSLSAGVWKRSGKKKLTKVLHFTTSMPTYRSRLGFYDGSERVFVQNFPKRFEQGFAKALATARK